MTWSPAEITELIKAMFFGISLLCVPLGTVYIMISAHRLQKLSTNVDRLEKNTNSISERNQAIAQKLGVVEGIAQERASVQANMPAVLPLPVTDEKAAEGLEKVVEAIQGKDK